MNHDYEHCLDFTRDCPKDCFRAELSRDLKGGYYFIIGAPISYMHLKGSEECKLGQEEKEKNK